MKNHVYSIVSAIAIFSMTSYIGWSTYTTSQNQIGFVKIEQTMIAEIEKSRYHNTQITSTLQSIANQMDRLGGRLDEVQFQLLGAIDTDALSEKVNNIENRVIILETKIKGN